ncbi:Retrotransposon gag domain - like 10 [Theobroma cacao]|nr:Retrotransposon gag domain - like 10 [Theobroma cacao]
MDFLREFDGQYYTYFHQKEKKREFLNLKQGNMTIEEYETCFNELMSYVPELVRLEQDQVNYFDEGLHNEIRERMIVTGKESYKEVVQMALRAEKLTTENRQIRAEFAKRRNLPMILGQSLKRGRDSISTAGSTTSAFVASTRPPSQQSQPRSSRFDWPVMSSQGGTSRGLDRCRNCGGFHNGSCKKPVKCFQYGQQGHIKKDCPQLRWDTVATSTPLTLPSIPRRDTLISHSRQSPVIRSSIRNTGFDRSYVSISFASFSDRNLSPLEEEIVVHTPLGERLDFDLILGMDWLSTHRAKVDFFKKEVILQSSKGAEVLFTGERRVLPFCVISTLKALKLVRKGYLAYLAHVIDILREELKVENVPVVSEFPNVFPDELQRLSPDREFEFTIDLLSGTSPISIPPYRMDSTELKELKVQLKELVDKGFISPSTSLW